jgi:hypothetical protein
MKMAVAARVFRGEHMYKHSRLWMMATAWVAASLWMASGISFAQDQAYPEEADTEAFEDEGKGDEGNGNGAPQSRPGETQAIDKHSQGYFLDKDEKRRPHQIVLMMGFPAWFEQDMLAFTFPGLRWHLPIIHNAIPGFNNWFALELGAELSSIFDLSDFYDTPAVATVPLEVCWAVRLTPRLAAYAKGGVRFKFLISNIYRYGSYEGFEVGGTGQAGLMWNLSRQVNLRVETGYPHVLNIGFGFGM